MWQHYNPVRITAGIGCRKELSHALEGHNRVLLVTTNGMVKRGTTKELIDSAPDHDWKVLAVAPEPTIGGLDENLADLRKKESSFDAVVAMGGGSALDSGKALSLALNTDNKHPFHEWLLEGKDYSSLLPIQLYCLPTTAGTGSEVTPFATIWDKKNFKKYSLESKNLFPFASFVDPELTMSLPEKVTLYSALDALSHSLETLWNKTATPISTNYALKAIDILIDAFDQPITQDMCVERREKFQTAALLAGLAISQNHTSIAHAISYPLTAHYGVPHGLACSVFLEDILNIVEEKTDILKNRDLVNKVKLLLTKQELKKVLNEYCTNYNILDIRCEILSTSRSLTFILDSNENYLDKILKYN